MKRIWGILVLGFTSSFFFTSAALPSRIMLPVAEYLTTFGLVDMSRLKLRVTSSPLFFCSSNFAFTSKKRLSVAENCPVLSACRLSIRMLTVTPETE